MSGRHTQHRAAPKRSFALARHLIVGLAAVLVICVGVFGITRVIGGCGDGADFTVAADASIAPVVKKLVDDSSHSDLGCSVLTVTSADSAATLGAISRSKEAPALWIPDSSLWLARAGQSTGMPVDVASDSVAATPAVLVSQDGKAPSVDSWLKALGRKGLRLGDPLTSSVSSAPIVGSLAESEENGSNAKVVSAVMVPIAQAQSSKAQETNQAKRIDEVLSDGGDGVVSEQQLVSRKGGKVAAGVPKTGTVFLNYPMAVTEPASGDHAAAKKAGKALAALLASDEGREALSEAAFRGPDGAPLAGGRGVGKVKRLTLADQSSIQAALKNYALLALPTRALAVEDVSGSMAFAAGERTRMALTIKASETGVGLFPDNSQVGLWSFSVKLDGNNDYKKLLPIRRMDAEVGGSTHRKALIKGIRGLTPKTGGSTGLYDTTLAAYRAVKEGYDPKAINSVIMLTDGANEDPGSISLNTLIKTLKKEQDPTRPVIIVTIGVTGDADAATLKKISAATGGTSFVARDPADIVNVFVKALTSRAG